MPQEVSVEYSYTTYGGMVDSENNCKTMSCDGGTPLGITHVLSQALDKGLEGSKNLACPSESQPVFLEDYPHRNPEDIEVLFIY